MKKIFLLLLMSLPLVCSCATSPLGRSQLTLFPDSEVNNIGVQAFTKIKKGQKISENQATIEFVQCVAQAIIKNAGGNWEVVVFDDESLNAFALPGNKIGVHTGLVELVDNADQLAVVIGHEIGHVQARHGNERMSQNIAVQQGISITQAITTPQSALGKTAIGLLGVGAQYGIILPFSRLHESEADIIGLDLMAKAGFNPQESINLWLKMEHASQDQNPPEFLSTHPAHDTRIQDLQQHMPEAIQTLQQAIAAGNQPHCLK